MSATHICNHNNLSLSAEGEQFGDSNVRLFRSRVTCLGCGMAFRAVGVRHGVSIDAPSTLDDGETIVVPMVPAGEFPDTTTRELLAS
jgi:hypothetical protein